MIPITERLAIDDAEIQVTFIQASGPGGQNVNKVATAAQLRFDAAASPNLTEALRARLKRLAGRRMTRDGVVVITARRFRTQEGNRKDAVARLVALLREAALPPTRRRPTRPSKAAKARRLDDKHKQSQRKRLRKPPGEE